MGHFYLVIISLFNFFEKSEKQMGHFYLQGVFSLFEIRTKVWLDLTVNITPLLFWFKSTTFLCSYDFRESIAKSKSLNVFPIKRSGGLLCLTMFAVKFARDSVERNWRNVLSQFTFEFARVTNRVHLWAWGDIFQYKYGCGKFENTILLAIEYFYCGQWDICINSSLLMELLMRQFKF